MLRKRRQSNNLRDENVDENYKNFFMNVGSELRLVRAESIKTRM